MCGLWMQELGAAKETGDVQKNVPLICFLKCDRGMPLTCGFGKLGKTEIQCYAGFDSGFIAMWTVNCYAGVMRMCGSNFRCNRHSFTDFSGRKWHRRFCKNQARG